MTKETEIDIKIDVLTKRHFQDLSQLQKITTYSKKMNAWDGECTQAYYFGDISTNQIIEKALLENPVVLDIGCGESGGVPKFLREKFIIQAFGILAPTGAELPDYIHGVDAHFLSEEKCFHSIEFDFIFSQMAFLHFVNPIKALQEAYLKLKVNGIMLIGELVIPGLSQIEFVNMMEYMKKQGYELSYLVKPGNSYMGLSTLVIKKTNDKPKLLFPVEIKKVEDNKQEVRAIYSLTIPLQSISEKKDDVIYHQAKVKLRERFSKIVPKGKSGVDLWFFIKKNIKDIISLKEIFIELLPLSTLLKARLNSENPFIKHIHESIYGINNYYLEGFQYFISTAVKPLSTASLDDFVEAIMFVTHQDFMAYQRNLQFSQKAIDMGLPSTEEDVNLAYSTPAILKMVVKHMPASFKDLILDSQYWITQSVLSLSIPVGIKNMQDLIKKPEDQKNLLKGLQEIIAKRPQNGSKKYYLFTHEQAKITENLYKAITKASTWESLLQSEACQAALKDRQTFYESINVTIPYSP